MMSEFSKAYYDLLVGEYSGINLTRIVDYGEFCVKQIQDSVEPFLQSKVFSESVCGGLFLLGRPGMGRRKEME